MTNRFIVTPLNGERFITTKNSGDKSLIVNTSIENAKDVNRIGVVVSIPLDYEGNIQVGDNVVVQHNVFRTYFDGQGVMRESDFHIKEDLFFVQPDLIYLIIRDGKKISVDYYCFVEPVFEEKKWIGKEERQHVGKVKYTNSILSKLGIEEGSIIAFKEHSEYEFQIEEETLYRIRTNCILAELQA